MSLSDILEKSLTDVPAGWRGAWARVWYQPNIFSQQKYIIGVLAYSENRLVDFKFIQDTRKFRCVYDASAKYALDETLKATRIFLAEIRELNGPLSDSDLPPGLTVERVGYVAGPSASLALEEAMSEDEVPMEYREVEKSPRAKLVRLSSQQVYDRILAKVIERSKQGAPQLRSVNFGEPGHRQTVNLVADKKAGMIANGWSDNPDKVVLELYRSASTVESYMALAHLTGEPAVFMLRPTEEDGLLPTKSRAIEDALNEASWKLEQKGMRIVTDNKDEFIAEQISEWASVR